MTRPARSPVHAAASSGAAPHTHDRPSAAPPSSAPGIDDLTSDVYRLADNGIAVVEIARQLGQHTGKVELILALRQG